MRSDFISYLQIDVRHAYLPLLLGSLLSNGLFVFLGHFLLSLLDGSL